MTWAPTNLLLRFYHNHKEVRTVLHDEYNIPRDAVNSIDKRKTDNGESAYQVQFREEYINSESICEFCEYSDIYKCDEERDHITIYRAGVKSDLYVERTEVSTAYKLTITYFDEEELRSESTSKLVMLSDFFGYRTQGRFKFTED